MSCRKCRRWHFRDPKFKNFLGEHAPRFPQVWGAFSMLTCPLHAPSNSHVLYAADYIFQYLIAYEINAQGWKKRLIGIEGVKIKFTCFICCWLHIPVSYSLWNQCPRMGGGGCILKLVIAKRGTIFICDYLCVWGGKFWYTTLFWPPRPPPLEVINDRSLMMKSVHPSR